jgi:hypothetical protein
MWNSAAMSASLEAVIAAAKNGHPDDFDGWKAEAGVVLRHCVGAGDPLVNPWVLFGQNAAVVV